MFDADGEIGQTVTQQAVQATPAKPILATGVTQTDVHFYELQNLFASQANLRSAQNPAPDLLQIANWQMDEVQQWVGAMERFSGELLECLRREGIDGEVLLALTEEDVRDMRLKLGYKLPFGELKKFWLTVFHLQLQWKHDEQQRQNLLQQHLQHKQLQQHQQNGGTVFSVDSSAPLMLGISGHLSTAPLASRGNIFMPVTVAAESCPCPSMPESAGNNFDDDTALGKDKLLVAPEYFKTAISLGYSFAVTWITSFVMVIVHERVPDMKRYPPLPDIFLDNVPHIPWAFNMCEITGSLLFTVWLIVLTLHKYRMVLLRRFFALAGTVFLLRCVTMLITSLSVPGTHLQCNQKDFAIDDPNVDVFGALVIRMTRAYRIWSGLGMSIQGVRTCGDYMFSGHTVALTLLNFFITEYTPRNLYFLHTLTWLLNMFGIFFILAAHEHYSIDVFVAFYITSRLFLYYHTLANNRALMQSDSTRTRIWFPMFSYFENSVDGIIPNEFDTAGTLIDSILQQIYRIKDQVTELTKHVWSDLSGNSNNTSAAGSNFITANQSLVANIQSLRTAVTNAVAATPAAGPKGVPLDTASAMSSVASQQLKRVGIEASSPYTRSVSADLRTPLTEKKVL